MEDLLSENPLVLLVIACEIGFWVVLGAGLVARYPMRRPRLGGILLVCVPVVDLVLVTASVVDIARGTPPGFSLGHTLVRWADVRFAHRYAGGPAPARGPRDGLAALPRELKDFGRALVAAVIAGAVLLVLSLVAGTGIPPVAEWMEDPLWSWTGRIGVVLAIWFVTGPVWVALGPRSGRA